MNEIEIPYDLILNSNWFSIFRTFSHDFNLPYSDLPINLQVLSPTTHNLNPASICKLDYPLCNILEKEPSLLTLTMNQIKQNFQCLSKYVSKE